MAVTVARRSRRTRARPGAAFLPTTAAWARASSRAPTRPAAAALAGPLVAAAVCLDVDRLRGARCAPLGMLDDSKRHTEARREELFEAVVSCASQVAVCVVPGARDRPPRPSPIEPARARAGALRARSRARRLPHRRLSRSGVRAHAPRRGRRRRPKRCDRRGVHHREGHARPVHAAHRPSLSGVRVRAARRLHHARAHARGPGPR